MPPTVEQILKPKAGRKVELVTWRRLLRWLVLDALGFRT